MHIVSGILSDLLSPIYSVTLTFYPTYFLDLSGIYSDILSGILISSPYY